MSKTDYPELNKEIESNGHGPAEEPSTEEKLKDLAAKVRPYVQQLWKARKKFLLFNTLVFILGTLYLFFLAKPYYISTITILPEYGSKSTTLGQLGDLAAMAGVKVGEGAPTEIYQNLITSESVLEPVIYAKYQTKEFSKPVNLIEYFEIEPDESLPLEQQERKQFLEVYEELTKHTISTGLERLTKILSFSVKTNESKLSAGIANKIAITLDDYIRTKKRSYASEQRFYLEKRVMQVKDSLVFCENMLRHFKEQNRVIAQSPTLMLEQTRLLRNVEIMQAVFMELTKQLEIAKIDEIKNTPVVNIKEEAREPVIKTGPKRLTTLIIILFFSSIFSALFVIFKDNINKYYRIIKGEE